MWNFSSRAACLLLLCLIPSPSGAATPLVDSPDVPISSLREHESSIAVSPLNPDFLIAGIIRPVPARVVVWVSTDGGQNWTEQAVFQGAGDPAVAVSGNALITGAPYGRLWLNSLIPGVANVNTDYLDNPIPSAPWLPGLRTVGLFDKNHMVIDNGTVSPGKNDVYVGWSEDVDVPPPGILTAEVIKVARSIDDGLSWTQMADITDAGDGIGVNLQTGRTGTVYAVWLHEDSQGQDLHFSSKGFLDDEFAPSSSLGLSIQDVNTAQLRNKIISGKNSFPSMAIDRSDLQGDHLYVVWTDRAGQGLDIRIMKGFAHVDSNGAVSWDKENITRVNSVSGDDNWWPWVAWDECTGQVVVTYTSSQGFASVAQKGIETFVAVSGPPDSNGQYDKATSFL